MESLEVAETTCPTCTDELRCPKCIYRHPHVWTATYNFALDNPALNHKAFRGLDGACHVAALAGTLGVCIQLTNSRYATRERKKHNDCMVVSDAPMWSGFLCLDCHLVCAPLGTFDPTSVAEVISLIHEVGHVLFHSLTEEDVAEWELYAAFSLFGINSPHAKASWDAQREAIFECADHLEAACTRFLGEVPDGGWSAPPWIVRGLRKQRAYEKKHKKLDAEEEEVHDVV